MDGVNNPPNPNIQNEDEARMDVDDNDQLQLANLLQPDVNMPMNHEAIMVQPDVNMPMNHDAIMVQPDGLQNAAIGDIPMILDVGNGEPNPNVNRFNNPGANPVPNMAALNPNPQAAPAGPRPMRCKTKKYIVTFRWDWDRNAVACGICRNPLVIRCNDCQVNGRGEGFCPSVYGTCNHVYHEHCIARWLETRNVCPIDNRPWVVLRRGT